MAAVPLDLLDRIRDLERQVRELAGRSQIRPAMDQVSKGNVRIGEGGTLGVYAPTGHQILGVGYWDNGEYGLFLGRQDGSTAMTIRVGNDEKMPQPVRLFDAKGNMIWADDVKTGGIAFPYLPLLPPTSSYVGPHWPRTEETSFTQIANSFNSIWQPKMRFYMHTAADSGTAGEVRVLVNDRPWGPAVRAGQPFDHTNFIGAAPGSQVEIAVEARRTSGTGSVYAQPKMLYGCET
ncbi:hypothetical protein Q3V23_18925 [Streptomyces sp. VNUA116]|uniref:hypothetical protein n=1 Tax=Streptomyces sp. VNUA116 TaxID=3062449 RepID=UPI00267683A0|nr:hypothetical protein [Streptomyces sp. VNUA116]WKU45964.1 hypothetical protein Q3V23_18925 [Streptomyces sp. VNUA116]